MSEVGSVERGLMQGVTSTRRRCSPREEDIEEDIENDIRTITG